MKKKKKCIKTCYSFKTRCPCYQSVRGCGRNCVCLGCENPHGERKDGTNTSDSVINALCRKRRASTMTTASYSGREFSNKNTIMVHNWSVLETLLLSQLLYDQISGENFDIDIDVIHLQYMQVVNNNDINPKTARQIANKVLSFLNDCKVFRVNLKQQASLN